MDLHWYPGLIKPWLPVLPSHNASVWRACFSQRLQHCCDTFNLDWQAKLCCCLRNFNCSCFPRTAPPLGLPSVLLLRFTSEDVLVSLSRAAAFKPARRLGAGLFKVCRSIASDSVFAFLGFRHCLVSPVQVRFRLSWPFLEQSLSFCCVFSERSVSFCLLLLLWGFWCLLGVPSVQQQTVNGFCVQRGQPPLARFKDEFCV